MTVPTLTFITSNPNKLAEVQAILSPSIQLESVSIDLPELQGLPLCVSKSKAIAAYKQLRKPVLVEDTSLCFNALNGLPGVYIKWFLESIGHTGLNNLLAAYDDKSAYAQCIFALALNENEVLTFVGRCHGRIVPARSATEKYFGWDPVFQPDESNGSTFAEMTKDEKNKISHRFRALEKLKEWLKKNLHSVNGTG